MDFYIKPRGKLFLIEDDSGIERSGLLSSYESAQARRNELENAARAQVKDNPGTQQRRQKKAAYRQVERDPVLKMLKNFLPRKGQIERTTRETYTRSLKFIGGHISIASSDPQIHAELNKTLGQRRTSSAGKVRREEGDSTREQVARRWKALSGLPERRRTRQIALEMKIGDRQVRRVVDELKLRLTR